MSGTDAGGAGREMDAAVAERVMGWRLIDRVAAGWGNGPPVWDTGADPDDPASSPTFQCFEPSTDVEHAWMVVEAMRAKGWHPLVNWLGRDRKCWHCYFEHESSPLLIVDTEGNRWNDDEIRGAHAYADTMPLAVCRAALSALAGAQR